MQGGLQVDYQLVKLSDLQLGAMVAKDIMANTQYPILYKNTKITGEHFPVLKAFQIEKIPIVDIKEADKAQQVQSVSSSIETIKETFKNSFERKYNESVAKFKQEFLNWDAGSNVNISKVRESILPLIDEVLLNKEKIFILNEYSTTKDYFYHHSIAISLISAVIAQKMNYSKGDITQIAIAAAVADAGMAKINKKIREKNGPLSEYEFKEIQEHPYYSLQMVNHISTLKKEMKLAIYQHHERLDGSGYPKGEKGSKVLIHSHIIAVADVFHAMTCERIYRSKESPFKVLEMIRENDFGKFNIEVVQALNTCVANLSLGTSVELSNGEEGTIIFANKTSPVRPVIKLHETEQIVDLSKNRNIYIERLILNN